MLQLTRLGGPVFALNPDLIERAEATPDTVVTLVNGSRYVIRESLEELTALIRDYRADVISAAQVPPELRRAARMREAGAKDTGPKDTGIARPNVVALRHGDE